MASNETKIFLCTANVGTVFECVCFDINFQDYSTLIQFFIKSFQSLYFKLGTMSKTYIDELVNVMLL